MRLLQRLRHPDLIPYLALIILLLVVFSYARCATSGIEYPPEYDAMRDMGIAQSILDGHYPGDPLFKGERLWYGPITGGCIALLSSLTGLPVNIVDAQSGAFINLLIPLAFFFLAQTIFGAWPALACTVYFLFVNALTLKLFTTATYSPWLYAPHLGQGVFYVLLALYIRVQRSPGWKGFLACGLVLALCFMTHVGPALLFGGIVLLDLMLRILFPKAASTRLQAIRYFFFMLLIAFLLSLPYTYPILRHYRMHIANPFPPVYMDSWVTLAALPEMLGRLIYPRNLLALLGALIIFRQALRQEEKALLIFWGAGALALLLNFYCWQWTDGWAWRPKQMVPGHHFFIMLAALRALLAGYALTCCFALALGCLMSGPAKDSPTSSSVRWGGGLAALLCLCWAFPPYAAWPEMNKSAQKGAYHHQFRDHLAAYEWFLENTDPDDVVLCEDYPALTIVGPAGRKVVSTMEIFANLYVPIHPRRSDRDAMLEAIRSGEEANFSTLAQAYQVRYVLVHDALADFCHRTPPSFLKRVFVQGRFIIYATSAQAL